MDNENGSVQSERKIGVATKLLMAIVGIAGSVFSAVVFAAIFAAIIWVFAVYAGVLADVVSDAYDTGKSLL